MSVIRESIMYVDCTAASPERGLTPVRCPRRIVIDCTTPEDALRTTKRAREDLELVCPDAPKKAMVARAMMVSPFAALTESPERRGPRRLVIDCTTPEDALRTTKRAREDLELVCPDAPKKARVARAMMVSPFAARLFPPPVSVRLHYTSDGAVKVVLSYNNEC